VALWLLDPSTEFILSAAEWTQGMLFGKKHDLKKQTQFTKRQVSLSIYMKEDYEEFCILASEKTKPIKTCPERSRMVQFYLLQGGRTGDGGQPKTND